MDNQVESSREMPKYECHKKVWALLIAELKHTGDENTESDGSLLLVPADEGYAPFVVDADYVRKHNPQVSGYYVVYADGYKSFSPADAFEAGYTRV